MAVIKEYFRHDYDASSDEKCVRLLKEHGPEGYGLYWLLVERLYRHGGGVLFDPATLAWEMRTQCDRIAAVMKSDLFYQTETGMLRSLSVDRRIGERKDISEQARKAAQLRWKNKQSMRAQCGRLQQPNARIGEDRIGENRRRKKDPPLPPKRGKDGEMAKNGPRMGQDEMPAIPPWEEAEKRKESYALAATQAPKKREPTPLQRFLDWYFTDCLSLEPGDPDPKKKAAVAAAYRRFGRAGKDVLAFAGGDPEKAQEGTQAIGYWMQQKGLQWTLDTIAKRFPDWMADPKEFAHE